MVTSAMASSFRVNASVSQLAAKSARYASRTLDEVESDSSDDGLGRSDLQSSRYRLLDERAKIKEAEDVARVIRELQAQRQSRARPQSARSSTGTNKLRASKDLRDSVVRETETESAPAGTRRPASARFPVARHKSISSSAAPSLNTSQRVSWAVGASSEQLNSASASASFQTRVLDELQRLKEAQRKDLEAIQQLQHEKELAERRARQLEQQFHSASMRSASGSSVKRRPSETLVIDEPSDDDGSTDNEDLDLDFSEDLGDESLPPPLYEDSAQSQQHPMTSSPCESSHDMLLSAPETSPRMWAKSSKRRVDLPAESTSPVTRSTRSLAARGSVESVSELRGRERSRSREVTHTRDRVSREHSQKQLVQTWDSSTEYAPESPLTRASARMKRTTSFRSRSPSTVSRTARVQRSSSAVRRSEDLSADVRRSSVFFEEKLRAKEEELRLATEAAERLERAKRAQPPQQLLERQEIARRKKQAQLKVLERELNAELGKDKRVKARDVPLSTYVVIAPSVSAAGTAAAAERGDAAGTSLGSTVFVTPDELEAQRKERIRQRSQHLLESAALPPRMALAASGVAGTGERGAAPCAASIDLESGALVFRTSGAHGSSVMSVKMKKQLAAVAEEQARKQRLKPKPVPDFDRLHSQWDKLLKSRKTDSRGTGAGNDDNTVMSDTKSSAATETHEFFVARAAKLAELKAKKAARRQQQHEKDEQARRAQREAQQKLLEKTRASSLAKHSGARGTGSAPKPTKADELRVKKVLERLAQAQKQQQREALDIEARQQRLKLAAKRVAAQVRVSERARVESRSDYVSISEVERLAKQRAQEFKRSLKESIKQNKERILGAVARKPSLMERFATDLKREEHKKNALEAVVKNVFKGNLRVMKDILTDEEHELACDIVAADRDVALDAENDGGKAAKSKSKKKSVAQDDGDNTDEYSDA